MLHIEVQNTFFISRLSSAHIDKLIYERKIFHITKTKIFKLLDAKLDLSCEREKWHKHK